MATWRYIKGSEKEFNKFSESVIAVFKNRKSGTFHGAHQLDGWLLDTEYELIAQRERVTSINDNRLARDVAAVKTLEMKEYTYHGGALWKPPLGKAPEYITDDNMNPKYNRPCKGVTIDVYDVLQAFNVTNPALQHLVKKALAVGQRGHKDKMEDLRDILASAQRAIELEEIGK